MKSTMPRYRYSFAILLLVLGLASSSTAKVPPPPANQNLGIPDGVFNNLAEAECRVCHEDPNVTGDTSSVDRHHLRMNTIVPDPTSAPNGTPGEVFECLTCHTLVWDPIDLAYEFAPFRDCLLCHQQIANEASVHHLTATAEARDCVSCHGDFVNNFNDGHYIPTYDPSLVTPWPSRKPNAGPNGEGNCTFCHDTGTGTADPAIDPDSGVLVFRNAETHHSTGFVLDSAKCAWCHNIIPPPNSLSIRVCEDCHGISTLHNIQFDNMSDGIDPGNEAPWYGHIGSNDDCWGCHGFSSDKDLAFDVGFVSVSSAPESGPVIPSIDGLSAYTMKAGSSSALTITGSAFVNRILNLETGEYDITLESEVMLTDASGNVVTLVPSHVTADAIDVTLPGTLVPGNYKLAAVKADKASNPVGVALKPPVDIDAATCQEGGLVLISGSGFSGYVDAMGSGTGVSAVIEGIQENAEILSWTDTGIQAQFYTCPSTLRVDSVFGTATAPVTSVTGWGPASVVGRGSPSASNWSNWVFLVLVPVGITLFRMRRSRCRYSPRNSGNMRKRG